LRFSTSNSNFFCCLLARNRESSFGSSGFLAVLEFASQCSQSGVNCATRRNTGSGCFYSRLLSPHSSILRLLLKHRKRQEVIRRTKKARHKSAGPLTPPPLRSIESVRDPILIYWLGSITRAAFKRSPT